LDVNGSIIQCTESLRDLGIEVTDNLEPSRHIHDITKKALRICNLIFRILKTKDVKIYTKAFITLVRPILEYAVVVWCPQHSKDINLVENGLRSYTRRLYKRCRLPTDTYRNRLRYLELQSLEERRVVQDLIFIYKLLCHNVDLDMHDFLLTLSISSHGHDKKILPLTVPSYCRTNTQINTTSQRVYNI
jgi:hypothetical protein